MTKTLRRAALRGSARCGFAGYGSVQLSTAPFTTHWTAPRAAGPGPVPLLCARCGSVPHRTEIPIGLSAHGGVPQCRVLYGIAPLGLAPPRTAPLLPPINRATQRSAQCGMVLRGLATHGTVTPLGQPTAWQRAATLVPHRTVLPIGQPTAWPRVALHRAAWQRPTQHRYDPLDDAGLGNATPPSATPRAAAHRTDPPHRLARQGRAKLGSASRSTDTNTAHRTTSASPGMVSRGAARHGIAGRRNAHRDMPHTTCQRSVSQLPAGPPCVAHRSVWQRHAPHRYTHWTGAAPRVASLRRVSCRALASRSVWRRSARQRRVPFGQVRLRRAAHGLAQLRTVITHWTSRRFAWLRNARLRGAPHRYHPWTTAASRRVARYGRAHLRGASQSTAPWRTAPLRLARQGSAPTAPLRIASHRTAQEDECQ